MTSIQELTRPFNHLNNEPQFVKDKYLEGIPYKDNNFPGPFLGVTQEQMNDYTQLQSNAVHDYSNISQTPLQNQAEKYVPFNQGVPNCENLGSRIPFAAPVQRHQSPGPRNAPGIEFSQNINRGYDPRQSTLNIAMNGMSSQTSSQTSGIEDFHDDSITDPQSQTGFGSIVPSFTKMPPGADQQVDFQKCSAGNNPLLDIQNRPIEQFSHNNMVPYYGSKITQNMSVTGTPQAGDNNTCDGVTDGFANATPFRGKLQNQTGTDEMWMHKRETSPMFSPAEQQTGWVFGAPAIRPDLDRYKTQVWKRHGEKPVESVKVGPGIGVDYTTPATGGFQQFTRVMPNNVTDYKANQLENRVTGGGWSISHPTSQYINGVSKNKPDLQITQARRPTQLGKFVTSAPSAGVAGVTNYTLAAMQGKQARSDTEQSAGYGQLSENGACIDYSSAPVGMTMASQVPQASQERNSYINVRETFRRGAGGYNEKTGFWECNDKTQGQEDWGIIMGAAKGAVAMGETRDGKYVNYTDRGDVNPYVINVTGTANGGGLWAPNSYTQPLRVTTKETTQYSNSGNIQQSKSGFYKNNWETDPLKVTTKETTQYSHAGNIQQGNTGFYKNNWDTDAPRVTRKETTQYSHAGNVSQPRSAFIDRSMFTGSTMLPK